MRKKFLIMLILVVLICTLCACDADTSNTGAQGNASAVGETAGMEQDEVHKQNDTEQDKTESGETTSKGTLTMLAELEGSGCSTEAGYYYLTGESVELKDGSYAAHLMYMDFATQQEIYLCNNAGCQHDTADCAAVFLEEDFQPWSTRGFVYQEKLYILSKKYDEEGTSTINYLDGEEVEVEAVPAALYRAGLDGTNREKIYTFDPDVTVEDFVIGNDKGIYVVTKKLNVEQSGISSYTTSSERNLVFLDLSEMKEIVICSMDFEDNISWQVRGCFDNNLILTGIDYGKEMSAEEYMNLDDEAMREAILESSDVYALLDVDNGTLKEVYRTGNEIVHSEVFSENMMYMSQEGSNKIYSIDLNTGEEKEICTLEKNAIYRVFGNMLCCHSWDWTDDATFYFVDTTTGEVHHSTLVNKCNGWSLEFAAELEHQILTIYDYEATAYGDGSYEITQYKYGLIAKEDLYAGNDAFLPIKMIGEGR